MSEKENEENGEAPQEERAESVQEAQEFEYPELPPELSGGLSFKLLKYWTRVQYGSNRSSFEASPTTKGTPC